MNCALCKLNVREMVQSTTKFYTQCGETSYLQRSWYLLYDNKTNSLNYNKLGTILFSENQQNLKILSFPRLFKFLIC